MGQCLHRSSHRLCRGLPGLLAYRQLQADQQQQAEQPPLQQQQRALFSNWLQHTLTHFQRNQLPGQSNLTAQLQQPGTGVPPVVHSLQAPVPCWQACNYVHTAMLQQAQQQAFRQQQGNFLQYTPTPSGWLQQHQQQQEGWQLHAPQHQQLWQQPISLQHQWQQHVPQPLWQQHVPQQQLHCFIAQRCAQCLRSHPFPLLMPSPWPTPQRKQACHCHCLGCCLCQCFCFTIGNATCC